MWLSHPWGRSVHSHTVGTEEELSAGRCWELWEERDGWRTGESLLPALWVGVAPAQTFRIGPFTNKSLTVCSPAAAQRLIAGFEALITLWEMALHSSC